VAVRSKASGRQTATLEVWGSAGGVIRHQQRRRRPPQSAGEAAGVNLRQRTKTPRLVRRHFNAHICSSANFGSRNFVLEPENFFETRLIRDSLTSLLAVNWVKAMHMTSAAPRSQSNAAPKSCLYRHAVPAFNLQAGLIDRHFLLMSAAAHATSTFLQVIICGKPVTGFKSGSRLGK